MAKGKAPGISITMELSQSSRELLRQFSNLLTPGEIDYAAGKGTDIIRDAAIAHAPHGEKTHSKNPGRLKEKIVSRISKRKQTIDAYVGAVYGPTGAPHAHLVEHGTKNKRVVKGEGSARFKGYGPFKGQSILVREVAKMPAQPFVQKALDEKIDETVRAISNSLTQRIQKKLNQKAK